MLELCEDIATRVEAVIKPIIGTRKALNIDLIAEKTALKMLKDTKIPMIVVSEEAGKLCFGTEPEYICLLDPIDGTYNALHSIPLYSISIAFARYKPNATLKDIEFGLVKNLATGDLFKVQRGKKPTFNNKSIKTSNKRNLGDSTLCVYIQNIQNNGKQLLQNTKRVRVLGSVAIELCYVAKGDYEGFVDLRNWLRNTDIAAGKVMVEEAGGLVSDEHGEKVKGTLLKIDRMNLVACGNRYIQERVLKSLSKIIL